MMLPVIAIMICTSAITVEIDSILKLLLLSNIDIINVCLLFTCM